MESVHIHKSKLYNNFGVFLLLIPSIIFILILAFYIFRLGGKQNEVASTSQSDMMGENTFDIQTNNVKK